MLVESEAPGAMQPGHSSYLPAVASEIARLTGPASLRALPGRGPDGFVQFSFVHAAYGGARLVEVRLKAEPSMQTPALRAVRGREAGSLEQTQAHAQGSSNTSTMSWTGQPSANLVVRYRRPDTVDRMDRDGMSLGLSNGRSIAVRSGDAVDNRLKERTERAADFDGVDYVFTASVRSQLVAEWPAHLPGGIIQAGLLSFSSRDGSLVARLLASARELLVSRPVTSVTVPASTVLRFPASESVTPLVHAGPRPPALLSQDPLTMAPQQALALGVPLFPADSRLVPTGTVPVYEFNAFPELTRALHAVAPRSGASRWLPVGASAEVAATRLSELIQAGETSAGLPRGAVRASSRMPGSWPLDTPSSAPVLGVSLYDPRPVTDTSDMAVDRVRVRTRITSSSSAAGSSLSLTRTGMHSLMPGNVQMLAFTSPLLANQPHTVASDTGAGATRYDRLRTGQADEPEDRRGMRSYETLVDAVIKVNGPEGTQYVTGSATVRLAEQDVLGFGVTPARPVEGLYDLPAMLAEQHADDLRDWARHPVSDLPQVLADGIDERDASAQLWLSVGSDPNGDRLARALFVASRTALAAGKPVELVVRTVDGTRYWPFAADGTLTGTTAATRGLWQRTWDTVEAFTAAMTAEARAVADEQELLADQIGRQSILLRSEQAVAAATADHQASVTARENAWRQAAIAQERANAVVRKAEAEVYRTEQTVRDAETLPTAEQVRQARRLGSRRGPTFGTSRRTWSLPGPGPAWKRLRSEPPQPASGGRTCRSSTWAAT